MQNVEIRTPGTQRILALKFTIKVHSYSNMGTSAIDVQQESKQDDAHTTLESSSNVVVILDAVRSTARGEVSLPRLRTKHRQAQIFVLTVESCSLGRWKQANR